MDKQHSELFAEIVKQAAALAEQVAEYDRAQSDEHGEQVALTMRDDYNQLFDKMNGNNVLLRNAYAKILAATYIITNSLEGKKTQIEKAIHGYKVDIIPKLNRIITETSTDDDANEMASQLFKEE